MIEIKIQLCHYFIFTCFFNTQLFYNEIFNIWILIENSGYIDTS